MAAKILSPILLLSLLFSGFAKSPHTHADDLQLPVNHDCCPHFHFGSHSHKECLPNEFNGLEEPDNHHDDDAIYLDGSPQLLSERKQNFCDTFLPLDVGFVAKWDSLFSISHSVLNQRPDIPERPTTPHPLSILLCCYRC